LQKKKRKKKEDSADMTRDEEEEEEEDRMPEPIGVPLHLPTLLESAHQFARSEEDMMDLMSTASSRPTTVSAIPTPSIPASNFESLANSSLRAECDKESQRAFSLSAPSIGAPSIGVPSICGTIDAPESIQGSKVNDEAVSIVGSVAESRVDSAAYLQDLESARDARKYAESVFSAKSWPLPEEESIFCSEDYPLEDGSGRHDRSFGREDGSGRHDRSFGRELISV
jgi:hypothetical protein